MSLCNRHPVQEVVWGMCCEGDSGKTSFNHDDGTMGVFRTTEGCQDGDLMNCWWLAGNIYSDCVLQSLFVFSHLSRTKISPERTPPWARWALGGARLAWAKAPGAASHLQSVLMQKREPRSGSVSGPVTGKSIVVK